MALTHIQCRQARPKDKPYKLTEGSGLYLLVNPNGRKYWRYSYRFGGKEKTMALGVFDTVSLAEAKVRHQAARELLSNGKDPMMQRQAQARADRQAQETSFKTIAIEWQQSQASGWSDTHVGRVAGLFENHLYPDLADRPISELTPLEVLDVIRKMEARGLGESCYKALSAISKVCMYAVVSGRAATNPAAGLRDFLKPAPPVKHHAHVDESELGKLVSLIDVYGGMPQTRIAIKLVMLCFMRSAELRLATWGEIDWEAQQWHIPSERRKGSKTLKASGIPHIVPLSRQAMLLLRELQQHTGNRTLMFEGQKPRVPISENTINKALTAIGYGDEQSTHGFRGLASTILNENGFNRDAIDRQLSHQEQNQVRRAYDHSQRMAERTTMMQWWAEFLESKAGSNVVPLPPPKKV